MNTLRLKSRSAGFILIYVAAILIFLTVLVLHSSREVRGEAQVAARLQEYISTRDRLPSAGALLQARLLLLWAKADLGQRNLSLFVDQPVGMLEVDGVEISRTFIDADLQPDANQLTAEEWGRLLVAYGMAEGDAKSLAEQIDAMRQKTGGFESIADLASTQNLPLSLVQGYTTTDGETYPALADLLTVGGGSRRLHLANSPAPLLRTFNATQEQVDRLLEIRRSREPTMADVPLIFGSDPLKVFYTGKPEKLRVRLEIAGVPLRLEFELSVRNSQLVFTLPRMLPSA